jgi:hypothetical protein
VLLALIRLDSSALPAVRAHPFFASINWDALLRREIKPDFVPALQVSLLHLFRAHFVHNRVCWTIFYAVVTSWLSGRRRYKVL